MTKSNPHGKFTLSLGEPRPLHAAVLSHREMRFVVVIGFVALLADIMGLAVIFGAVLGRLIHQ